MQLPEAAPPEEAKEIAQQYLKMGLDGIKLFTGAFMADKPVINMDTAIVRAASDVAHAEASGFGIRRTERGRTMRWLVALTCWHTPFRMKVVLQQMSCPG